jgi:hypothetical protein
MEMLKEWESFYVIVGSSAGALIGLQFVVMTLIAERPEAQSGRTVSALGTPTIVHFGAVLLLSSLLSAPWKSTPSIAWGGLGVVGVVYCILVARKVRAQTEYKPVLEDWFYYVLLPLTAYGVLVVSAFVARAHEREALFAQAGAALLLLFDGIHNAWDSVVYHVTTKKNRKGD